MTATFNPTVRILGGENIKLHKYMPNMEETATSNAAVVKLVTKAENRGAGWPPSSAWLPKKGTRFALWEGLSFRQQTSSATQVYRLVHRWIGNYVVQGRRKKRPLSLQIA